MIFFKIKSLLIYNLSI